MSAEKHEENTEAFDRLKESDPASSATFDERHLHSQVRKKTNGRGRKSRNVSFFMAFTALAATLAIGVGVGAGYGASAPKDSASGEGNADPSGLIAPIITEGATKSMAAYGGTRIIFSSSGLSEEPGSLEAWTYNPKQAFTKENAELIASAVGLSGEAALNYGAWVVGPTDGVGPTLQLQADGMTSVNYYDPSLELYRCMEGTAGSASGSASAGSVAGDPANKQGVTLSDEVLAVPTPGTMPAPECATETQGTPEALSVDIATERVKNLLKSFNLDPAAYKYEGSTQPGMNSGAAYINAFILGSSERVGVNWSFNFAGDKVQSFYGTLAPLVSLGNYETVSAAEAVERLSDPRFSTINSMIYADNYSEGDIATTESGGSTASKAPASPAAPPTASTLGAEEGSDSSGSSGVVAPDPAEKPTLPDVVASGAALPWPVQRVTITKAELGLALYSTPSGASMLLPSYTLASDDGATWTAIGVDAARLDFSSK